MCTGVVKSDCTTAYARELTAPTSISSNHYRLLHTAAVADLKKYDAFISYLEAWIAVTRAQSSDTVSSIGASCSHNCCSRSSLCLVSHLSPTIITVTYRPPSSLHAALEQLAVMKVLKARGLTGMKIALKAQQILDEMTYGQQSITTPLPRKAHHASTGYFQSFMQRFNFRSNAIRIT